MQFNAILLLGASALLAASVASADTVHTRGGAFPNVQITGIEGNLLMYSGGGTPSHELADVKRLEVDGETAFNAAEVAYESSEWQKATEGYARTIRSTNKAWLKQYVALRLFETADKAGDFSAAVTAYISVIQTNPAAAAGREPKLPDASSTLLDTAAADVERALQAKLDDAQKGELLKFLLSIHQKKNDVQKMLATAERLEKLGGDAIKQQPGMVAMMRLSMARVALDKKDYARAKREIDSARTSFTEPAHQAAALYVLAEVEHAVAKDDKQKLPDVAIAYMRVVAHFPQSEQAGDSLVKTAQVLETMGDVKKALALYQQAAAEYPATQAKDHVDRLKGQKSQG